MNKEKILQKLNNDEDYYGEFGKQFLSNSDIYYNQIESKIIFI